MVSDIIKTHEKMQKTLDALKREFASFGQAALPRRCWIKSWLIIMAALPRLIRWPRCQFLNPG